MGEALAMMRPSSSSSSPYPLLAPPTCSSRLSPLRCFVGLRWSAPRVKIRERLNSVAGIASGTRGCDGRFRAPASSASQPWRTAITIRNDNSQNADFPRNYSKREKKPFPIPVLELRRRARQRMKQAEGKPKRSLPPPKNGLLVYRLIPEAYRVYNARILLINNLKRLMKVVPIKGCKYCSEIHVGSDGHPFRTCRGMSSDKRRGEHDWGSTLVEAIFLPVEAYHLEDRLGPRITHDQRFEVPRIPALVELCIQAGVEHPEYPTKRRRKPIIKIGTTLGLTQPSAVEPLQVTFAAIDIEASDWKGDVLAVLVTENDLRRSPTFENAVLDGQLGGGGFLSEALAEEDFAGRSGQSVVLRLQGQGFKRLCLVGLGRDAPSTVAACQSIGDSVASIAKSARAGSAAVVLASPGGGIQEEFRPNAAAAIASGVVLGLHEDNRYRSESKKVHLKQVDLIGFGYGPEVDRKLKLADHITSGVIFGKDLVNSPANVLTPVVLAEEASKIASTYSDVFTATILDEERCRELKMGSYLGVAAASANPPRFIHLCYKPPGGNIKRKLAIVGKGLTFDSGGYNIKVGPICSIELMKWDMGGSAAVFGAAKALGQIKPPGVEVHFIVAACENMISGTGMRPGDIVTASNGKTIQVNNTDAEGRLTLADALVYACKQGVDKIVDLATLTGACRVALGPSIAGILTQSDELHDEVAAASEVSGEKFWRLPFEESYWDSMKSGVADMLNTGAPQGGVITAALFLKQFVDEEVQWMHIDIAGPVWSHKKRSATGFGVSTMVEWVLKNSS